MQRPYLFLYIATIVSGTLVAQSGTSLALAVSDLSAQGIKESEAAIVTDQLRAELMRDNRIRIMERTQMQEILKEQGFQQSGCTNDACAVEIGQMLGVQSIVVGSIGVAGSYTVVTARILDVATGEIRVNATIRTKGGINQVIEKGVAGLSKDLIAQLFPGSASPVQSPSASATKKGSRIAILGGIGALAVGGGVAAAIVLGKASSEEQPQPGYNVRIDLP